MLVGITVQKLKHPSYQEVGYYLDERWQKFASEINIHLIPLTDISVTSELIEKKGIAAFILSGGGNLSSFFPEKREKNKISIMNDIGREEIESYLIKASIAKGFPLIGICRGMQAIGKYFGWKLSKVKNHVNTLHELQYHCPIINKKIIRTVNSYHDFGFNTVSIPEEFEVSATYDNVAEQMINKEKNLLGLMWHPERESIINPLDKELFTKFLKKKI